MFALGNPSRWIKALLVVLVISLTGCFDIGTDDLYDGAGGGNANVTPVVDLIKPDAGSNDVPINTSVSFRFTQEMDPATVSTSTVTLASGSFVVVGAVEASTGPPSLPQDFTFIPENWLAPNTTYILRVSQDVKNTNGLSMENEFVSSFTTGSTTDSIPPTIISIRPEADATEVDTGGGGPMITFSEFMDPTSFDEGSFRLSTGGVEVPGFIRYYPDIQMVGYITPHGELDWGTTYTATLSGTVRDLSGNALGADYSWSFKTASLP